MSGTLKRLLDRPWYLPRPTREELVAAALRELHQKMHVLRRPSTPKDNQP